MEIEQGFSLGPWLGNIVTIVFLAFLVWGVARFTGAILLRGLSVFIVAVICTSFSVFILVDAGLHISPIPSNVNHMGLGAITLIMGDIILHFVVWILVFTLVSRFGSKRRELARKLK